MSRTLVDSGIDWIGKIPSNWNIVKVNKIFFRRKEVNKEENPTILSLARSGVKIRDISTNEGQLAESYDNYHKVYIGDLMLNPMDLISGANCSMSEVSGVISPAYINLAKKEDCNSKYYDYFFKNQYWVNAMFIHGKGVSFNNRWTMNSETIMDYKIPLPPLEEQNKIVDYLDRKCSNIDKVIEDNNNSIVLLEEYKSSVISESVFFGIKNLHFEKKNSKNFGTIPAEWDDVNIKSIFSFKKGLSITKENLVEIGIPVISYGQIHSKNNDGTKVREELIRYVSDVYMSSDEKALTFNKDIIFADTSEDLDGAGNCIYIDTNYPIFAGYHTIIASPKTEITKYFAYLFKTEKWRSQVRSSVYGVKLFSITQKILKNCNVLVPSLEEQKEIVDYLEKKCSNIDKVIEYRKKIIEKLEEYKKSLIYEVVTGKKEV